jgi:hypothetical protein
MILCKEFGEWAGIDSSEWQFCAVPAKQAPAAIAGPNLLILQRDRADKPEGFGRFGNQSV